MKKQLLVFGALTALTFSGIQAQQKKAGGSANTGLLKPTSTNIQRCSTQEPGAEWDQWFNAKVEEYKAQQEALKSQGMQSVVNYTIPVVVHVIHAGEAVGTATNISAAQVQDQLNILNADYAGTGLNSGNVPSQFSALKANCNITFCLAQQDPNGTAMAEPGIHRVQATTIPGITSVPANGFSTNTIDNTIKPNTIWSPLKYCNMWVLKLSSGLLGYATFPAGSTLTGITGTGTTSNDGVVMGYNYFGSIGAATGGAPYNKGRTTTHEVGHWLGLRHIWGDDGTACTGSDFCNDTPNQAGENYGCPTFPKTDACTAASPGVMFMNFMDYTDDACMYMFTNDQRTRMQTCMANGTYRAPLATSTACNTAGPSAPIANFNVVATGCLGTSISITNNTSGNPAPTYAWSASPSAGVTFTPSATNATSVTFANAGTYTVQLIASNSQGSNTTTDVITINNCTVTGCDTLTNFLNTDTLFSIGSSNGGYVAGNNGYDDRKKAEYYSSVGLTTSQVTGGIVLFYKNGTAGTTDAGTPTNINIQMFNGSATGGPTGTALRTHTTTIANAIAGAPVTGVTYCGDPNLAFTNPIIYPYNFNFTTPQAVTQDFFMSVGLPTNGTDTVAIFMTSGNTAAAATAWEEWSGGAGWYSFNDGTGNTWQLNASLAILPKVNCTVGINDANSISNNIAVFPNPSNGQFNFVTTLPVSQDLTFSVYNAMGQMVYEKVEKNVSNNMISLDLSNQAKGIYIVNISSPNGERSIQRLIIK